MNNYLLSSTIGDIAECFDQRSISTINLNEVKSFPARAHITGNSICTFACAEALINDWDLYTNVRQRGDQQESTTFRFQLKKSLGYSYHLPYAHCGIGSAIRSSSAGWLATDVKECKNLAEKIASLSSLDPEETKSSVLTAYSIFLLNHGCDKEFIRNQILNKYYREWVYKTY